jgi:hypothetical protein
MWLVRFAVALLAAVFLAGCFHWVPVNTVTEIDDARVRVESSAGVTILHHAHGCGGTTLAGSAAGQPPCACNAPCTTADITQAKVSVRKLDGLGTAGMITGAVLSAAATFFVLLVIGIATSGFYVGGG